LRLLPDSVELSKLLADGRCLRLNGLRRFLGLKSRRRFWGGVAHACIKISPSPRDLVVEVPSPPELRSPPDKCTCIGPFGGFVLLVFPSSGDVKLLLDCNENKKKYKKKN
jgi:hypothetical protein